MYVKVAVLCYILIRHKAQLNNLKGEFIKSFITIDVSFVNLWLFAGRLVLSHITKLQVTVLSLAFNMECLIG